MERREYFSVGGGGRLLRLAADTGLLHICDVMQECVAGGCHVSGVLPGGLKVRRRAAELRERLEAGADGTDALRRTPPRSASNTT